MDMSKRLRRKFIAVAMASVVVVLAGIVAAINVVNYLDVCNQADARLALIQQGGGMLEPDSQQADGSNGENGTSQDPGAANSSEPVNPQLDGEAQKGSANPAPDDAPSTDSAAAENPAGKDASKPADSNLQNSIVPRGNTAEMPFETRYFTVVLASDGSVSSVNIEKVAAVSSDEAVQMSQSVKAGSAGFMGPYRYTAVAQEDGTVQCIFLDCTRDLGNFTTFLTASVAISLVGLVLVFVLVFVLSRVAIRPVVESYQKQKAFITDASHEIKTPLAVISAANEVQEMENGETEWSRSIAEQVKRLSGLTEQLVQLARMDEGASLAKEEVDLSELVGEMAEPFYQLAQQRGKTLAVDIVPHVQVQGDAAALSQVVELLLDNATRYAKDGTQIKLALQKQGRKAKLSVSNEVEKMPEGNLDRLFERFYRSDTSRSSQTGGSGVGLSVVRSVAEAHGGTAKATAQGNVITFTVTI